MLLCLRAGRAGHFVIRGSKLGNTQKAQKPRNGKQTISSPICHRPQGHRKQGNLPHPLTSLETLMIPHHG